jgi:hypothetical protein
VASDPSRSLPRSSSPSCVTAAIFGKPWKPDAPLIEWTTRKIDDRTGFESGSFSSARSRSSNWASPSWHFQEVLLDDVVEHAAAPR